MTKPAPVAEDCHVYPPNRSAGYAGAIAWLVLCVFAIWEAFYSEHRSSLQGLLWLLFLVPGVLPFAIFPIVEGLLGLPTLTTVTRDGIALRRLFRTKRANWGSLGSFKLKLAGRQEYQAIADVLDSTASRSLFWKFAIPDSFSVGIESLVVEFNARRAQALGDSDTPSAAQQTTSHFRDKQA
jgi:hypothetical protein